MHPDHYYFKIYPLSESAVTIEFGDAIADDTLLRISRFNTLLQAEPFDGFSTTVPAYTTLTVFYDVLQVAVGPLPGADCFEKVSAYLGSLNNRHQKVAQLPVATITIPVCYGGNFGPDLEALAALHNISTDKVIELHTQAVYKVFMIGFVPGFAYLGGLNPLLATPRRPAPRQHVPAGSVGIGGSQTGVYPLQTPGGWQIIGQTPLKMFNAARSQPSLLKAGDRVMFKAITLHEFEAMSHE